MCIGKIYIFIKNVYLIIISGGLSILINRNLRAIRSLVSFFVLLIFNPVLFYKDIYVTFFLIKV